METTIYAVCTHCSHIEPRPLHSEEDWADCENCGNTSPELFTNREDALERSEEVIDWTGLDR